MWCKPIFQTELQKTHFPQTELQEICVPQTELQEISNPQTELQEICVPQTELQEICVPQTELQETHILEVLVDVGFDPVVDQEVPLAVESGEGGAGPPIL